MRRRCTSIVYALLLATAGEAVGDPTFVNGLLLSGSRVDATRKPGVNEGRLGFFSDLYYDPVRAEWWALSDRGRISDFRVLDTIPFTDPFRLLSAPSSTIPVGPPRALNGLNPLLLNSDASRLGRSFDPEGLVIDPRTDHFLVSDEYGPSVYEFDRRGRLIFIFETPANLVPKRNGTTNYVALRDDCSSAVANCFGRQDNRGFEGLAITPDGKKLYAVLQDPLIEEPGPRDGRNGRNVRIVVFDNDTKSPTFGKSVAQYAYTLELQSRIRARIAAVPGSTSSATDPRQGRNIGLSAIVALNRREFLVLERDNRGIGVDNPGGNGIDPATGKIFALGVVGSKRVYKITLDNPTDVSGIANLNPTPDGALPAGVVPVTKSSEDVPFIDLAANTMLPKNNQAEKWEGITIGPRLKRGGHAIVTGNDNDYSVTQLGGTLTQFESYVDFAGNYARCPIGALTGCERNGDGVDTGDFTFPLPAGYMLLPGVLHSYRASASDLQGYEPPRRPRGRHDHDCGHDGPRHRDRR
jgi:hypothetical protein